MKYRITGIRLKTVQVVTEREFSATDNVLEGAVPAGGEILSVKCRGRDMRACIVWGNWPGREIEHPQAKPHPLRVEEI